MLAASAYMASLRVCSPSSILQGYRAIARGRDELASNVRTAQKTVTAAEVQTNGFPHGDILLRAPA
jgi:hypothetical protein